MSTYLPEDTIVIITEWISQAEAARQRGISRQAIWKLIKKGRLRSINIAGHILVNRHDVEFFEPLEPGRRKHKSEL